MLFFLFFNYFINHYHLYILLVLWMIFKIIILLFFKMINTFSIMLWNVVDGACNIISNGVRWTLYKRPIHYIFFFSASHYRIIHPIAAHFEGSDIWPCFLAMRGWYEKCKEKWYDDELTKKWYQEMWYKLGVNYLSNKVSN